MKESRIKVSLRFFFFVSILLLLNWGLFSQTPGAWEIEPRIGITLPFGPKEETFNIQVYKPGVSAGLGVGYRFPSIPGLLVFGDFGYLSMPTNGSSSLNTILFSAGVDYLFRIGSRFNFSTKLNAGGYAAFSPYGPEFNPYLSAGIGFGFAMNRTINLRLGANYNFLFTGSNGSISTFYNGLETYAAVRFSIGGKHSSQITWDETTISEIFPVQYSLYAKEPFGKVILTNNESSTIKNVVVSVIIPEFMSTPAVCLRISTVQSGEQFDVPLKARFESSILNITEARWADLIVRIEYEYLDETVGNEQTQAIRIYDRNSMVWDDDQKASAFVSSKDPAVQRFASTVAGIARESEIKPMHLNFGIALAMFEALRIQGLNYVIDPTTPFAETSGSSGSVDYLQFPHQTLQNLGGDCDDLSILYTALLEAVGIETAFVTIPGHIFVAVNTGLTEEDAFHVFRDSETFIEWNGNAWLPIEITMINDGFLRAWLKGVEEWNAHSRKFEARLYPIHEAWKTYEPVGINTSDSPGSISNISRVKDVYEQELKRFLSRELEPQINELEAAIRQSGENPRDINRLGTLYARYGIYDRALEQFVSVSGGRNPYIPALVNVGNIQLLRNQFAEALQTFNSVLRLNSSSLAAKIGLVQARYRTEDYEGANTAIKEVEEIRPELAERLVKSYGTDNSTRAGLAALEILWSDE